MIATIIMFAIGILRTLAQNDTEPSYKSVTNEERLNTPKNSKLSFLLFIPTRQKTTSSTKSNRLLAKFKTDVKKKLLKSIGTR